MVYHVNDVFGNFESGFTSSWRLWPYGLEQVSKQLLQLEQWSFSIGV